MGMGPGKGEVMFSMTMKGLKDVISDLKSATTSLKEFATEMKGLSETIKTAFSGIGKDIGKAISDGIAEGFYRALMESEKGMRDLTRIAARESKKTGKAIADGIGAGAMREKMTFTPADISKASTSESSRQFREALPATIITELGKLPDKVFTNINKSTEQFTKAIDSFSSTINTEVGKMASRLSTAMIKPVGNIYGKGITPTTASKVSFNAADVQKASAANALRMDKSGIEEIQNHMISSMAETVLSRVTVDPKRLLASLSKTMAFGGLDISQSLGQLFASRTGGKFKPTAEMIAAGVQEPWEEFERFFQSGKALAATKQPMMQRPSLGGPTQVPAFNAVQPAQLSLISQVNTQLVQLSKIANGLGTVPKFNIINPAQLALLTQVNSQMSQLGKNTAISKTPFKQLSDIFFDTLGGIDKQVRGFEYSLRIAERGMQEFGRLSKEIFMVTLGAIVMMSKEAAQYSIEIQRMTALTGFSTKEASSWAFAANVMNVKTSEFNNMLKILARRLGDAQRGMEGAKQVFIDYGIAIEDSGTGKALKLKDVYYQVILKIKSIEDSATKSALAMHVFGRSYDDILPLVEAASGDFEKFTKLAVDMGVALEDKDQKALEELQQTFNTVGSAIIGVSRKIAVEFMPIFTAFRNLVADVGTFLGKHPGFAKFIAILGTLSLLFNGLIIVITGVLSVVMGLLRNVVLSSAFIKSFATALLKAGASAEIYTVSLNKAVTAQQLVAASARASAVSINRLAPVVAMAGVSGNMLGALAGNLSVKMNGVSNATEGAKVIFKKFGATMMSVASQIVSGFTMALSVVGILAIGAIFWLEQIQAKNKEMQEQLDVDLRKLSAYQRWNSELSKMSIADLEGQSDALQAVTGARDVALRGEEMARERMMRLGKVVQGEPLEKDRERIYAETAKIVLESKHKIAWAEAEKRVVGEMYTLEFENSRKFLATRIKEREKLDEARKGLGEYTVQVQKLRTALETAFKEIELKKAKREFKSAGEELEALTVQAEIVWETAQKLRTNIPGTMDGLKFSSEKARLEIESLEKELDKTTNIAKRGQLERKIETLKTNKAIAEDDLKTAQLTEKMLGPELYIKLYGPIMDAQDKLYDGLYEKEVDYYKNAVNLRKISSTSALQSTFTYLQSLAQMTSGTTEELTEKLSELYMFSAEALSTVISNIKEDLALQLEKLNFEVAMKFYKDKLGIIRETTVAEGILIQKELSGLLDVKSANGEILKLEKQRSEEIEQLEVERVNKQLELSKQDLAKKQQMSSEYTVYLKQLDEGLAKSSAILATKAAEIDFTKQRKDLSADERKQLDKNIEGYNREFGHFKGLAKQREDYYKGSVSNEKDLRSATEETAKLEEESITKIEEIRMRAYKERLAAEDKLQTRLLELHGDENTQFLASLKEQLDMYRNAKMQENDIKKWADAEKQKFTEDQYKREMDFLIDSGSATKDQLQKYRDYYLAIANAQTQINDAFTNAVSSINKIDQALGNVKKSMVDLNGEAQEFNKLQAKFGAIGLGNEEYQRYAELQSILKSQGYSQEVMSGMFNTGEATQGAGLPAGVRMPTLGTTPGKSMFATALLTTSEIISAFDKQLGAVSSVTLVDFSSKLGLAVINLNNFAEKLGLIAGSSPELSNRMAIAGSRAGAAGTVVNIAFDNKMIQNNPEVKRAADNFAFTVAKYVNGGSGQSLALGR